MTKDFLKPQFGLVDVEILERKTLFQGFFRFEELKYRHRLYEGGWSNTISREVLHRGEAIGAVLYDPANDLIGLVEQIRPGAFEDPNGPWCLEVVAGMVDPGEEDLDAVVLREMQEETGLAPTSIEYICNYMASPGGCTEKLHVYCAIADLSGCHGGVSGLDTEGEDIRLFVKPADDVFTEIYSGRFNNAATMIGLQWLQANRLKLRSELTL